MWLLVVQGAYLGLLIDAKFYGGTLNDAHQTPTIQTLKRFLLLLIIASFLGLLPILLQGKVQNLLIRVVIFYLLIPFIELMLLFGFGGEIGRRLGLLKQTSQIVISSKPVTL
jgi:hypothetical protein